MGSHQSSEEYWGPIHTKRQRWHFSISTEPIWILTLVLMLMLMLTNGVTGAIETNVFLSSVNAVTRCEHGLRKWSPVFFFNKEHKRHRLKLYESLLLWNYGKYIFHLRKKTTSWELHPYILNSSRTDVQLFLLQKYGKAAIRVDGITMLKQTVYWQRNILKRLMAYFKANMLVICTCRKHASGYLSCCFLS